MPFGWMGKILEVDLTTGEIGTRESAPYTQDYIGGRALASRLAWEEIPAGTDAYAPENRVIIATGPLTGTLAPTSGRTIMATVSPRTYPTPWYTHSTLGGWFGPELKYAGYDAIVLHGRATSPLYLEIADGRARLLDAGDLWGRDARETQLALKRRLGEGVQVLTIGPAGENLVRFATVQHAEDNAAGRSGFGAVWGSKNLKAIAVRGNRGVPVADPKRLLEEILKAGKYQITPTVSIFRPEGMEMKRPVCSQACTYNCGISRYSLHPDGRRSPGHCIDTLWRSEKMYLTEYRGGGIEVPAGKNFENSDEVRLYELGNSLGLDLWFRFSMQPWFIRCQQLGIDEIRGHRLDPENAAWFERFMVQLANREGLGAIFAEDMARAMDELAGELPAELVRLGREMSFDFGMPAHREGRFFDAAPLPFWVIAAMMHISAARDPGIGTHQSSLLLASFLIADRELALRQFRRLSEKVWGYPEALEPTFEDKAPVAVWSQDQQMLIDSLPLCDFAFPKLVRHFKDEQDWRAAEDIAGDLDFDLRFFAAVTGVELTREEMTRVARRAFTLERTMLALAGRRRAMEEALASHFQLPDRTDGTFIDQEGFSRLLDEYYSARGWDLEFGWPQPEELRRLGLEELGPPLDECRRAYAAG